MFIAILYAFMLARTGWVLSKLVMKFMRRKDFYQLVSPLSQFTAHITATCLWVCKCLATHLNLITTSIAILETKSGFGRFPLLQTPRNFRPLPTN